jgi:Tol biopolymer transport system component
VPGAVLTSCATVRVPGLLQETKCIEVQVLDCPVLSPTPPPQEPACPACAEWATVQSDRDGSYDIYRIDLEGHDSARLTDDPAHEIAPSRSYDGQSIAFASNREGDWDILAMNANGSDVVNLTKGHAWTEAADELAPSWGCQAIAFQSDRDGNWEIYVMATDGTGRRRLTDHPATDEAPAWSPDGEWIAFHSDRGGSFDIYVMDKDGRNLRRITTSPASDRNPTWSVDGRWLAFDSDRGEGRQIYKVNLGTGQVVQLTDGADGRSQPAWTPYCSVILYQESHADGMEMEVQVMADDGAWHRPLARSDGWRDALDLQPGRPAAPPKVNALYIAVVTFGTRQ